jgi:hypothetical protein
MASSSSLGQTPPLSGEQRSLVAEALHLSRFLISGDTAAADSALVQRRRDRIRQIQQQLQAWGHPVQRSPQPIADIPLAVRQAFVRSVLLVRHAATVGGMGWRGTLASPTLAKFRPDPIPPHWYGAAQEMALGDHFQVPTPWTQQLQADLVRVDEDIATQRRLMTAVWASVGVSVDDAPSPSPAPSPAPLPQRALAQLLQQLFGGLTLPPEQVHGVLTPTQIFFCLDFAPLAQAPSANPGTEGSPLGQLYQRLNSFSFSQFRRFPTFGPCLPEEIDGAWVRHLSDRTAIPPDQIVDRLSKSVGVLPLDKAEMFLIHDIWGHYWQLLLTQFDSDYASLADCDQPLRAGETAYTSVGPLTCRHLFHWDGDRVQVQAEPARAFFHGEVCQRLGLLFTHLLGELTADIAEFKFTWTNPQAAHELPSSSAFTDYPANLDLSLADLDFLFLRVLRPLLTVELSPLALSPLEMDLLADWQAQRLAPGVRLRLEASLKQAIAQLYHLFYEEYGQTYLPTVAAEESLFAQIVVNLLHLQNVINDLYRDPNLAQESGLPFQDVLVMFISAYCSGDSYAEFWQVDNVLADYFVPCWLHLQAAETFRASL